MKDYLYSRAQLFEGRSPRPKGRHRARLRTRAALLKLAAAVTLALAQACFDPKITEGACEYSCDVGCPVDWRCQEGLCVPNDFQGSCRTPSEEAGAGGSAGSISIPPHAGSGPGSGGTGGEAGGAGTPNAPLELNITDSPQDPLCAGESVRVGLEVIGGEAPYSWVVENNDCNLALDAAEGDASINALRGTPEEDCSASVTARDSSGALARTEVSIQTRAVPRLVTEMLAKACLQEEYSHALEAEGGDAEHYQFHVEGPSDFTLTENRLEGSITSADPREFEIWVEDGTCESQHQTLKLETEDADSNQCHPVVPLPLGIQTLPVPCAGHSYEREFGSNIAGGEWEPEELPPGLTFHAIPTDSKKARLTGVAEWAADKELPFRIRYTAPDGRVFRYTETLAPRDNCWLGYITRTGTDPSAPGNFRLYDPELGASHSFPKTGTGAVRSFAFSPDGRFSVYQSRVNTEPSTLALLNMHSLNEAVLTFDGSVENYAWSPDGSLLAVSYRSNDEVKLGGIDVSNAGADLGGVTYLSPVVAQVSEQLTWFGDRQLAYVYPFFILPEIPAPAIGLTGLSNNSFDNPMALENTYSDTLILQGIPSGLMVFDPLIEIVDFYSSTPAPISSHPDPGEIFSPHGLYYARIEDSVLTVFETPSFVKRATAEPGACGTILAWGEDEETIACVTDLAAEDAGEVRIFKANWPKQALSMDRVPVTYEYQQRAALTHRRLFSPKGTYFAFATDTHLYVHTLRDGSVLDVEMQANIVNKPDIDLAFSPDERYIIQQREGGINLYGIKDPLGSSPPGVPQIGLFGDVAAPKRCEEVAGPDWCGALAHPRDFKWSSDSAFAALLSTEPKIVIVPIKKLTNRDLSEVEIPLDCEARCEFGFAFQP